MIKFERQLEEKVCDVFECACQEQDLEVAEHLLQALEVLAKRAGGEGRPDDDADLRSLRRPH